MRTKKCILINLVISILTTAFWAFLLWKKMPESTPAKIVIILVSIIVLFLGIHFFQIIGIANEKEEELKEQASKEIVP